MKTESSMSDADLIGLPIRLDRDRDLIDACHANVTTLQASDPPHAYALRCAQCGKFRGHVSEASTKFIREVARLFGVPDEPLVLHDTTKANANESTRLLPE
jgi:hypothetical protein